MHVMMSWHQSSLTSSVLFMFLAVVPYTDVALGQIAAACSLSGCTYFSTGLTVTVVDISTNASKVRAVSVF